MVPSCPHCTGRSKSQGQARSMGGNKLHLFPGTAAKSVWLDLVSHTIASLRYMGADAPFSRPLLASPWCQGLLIQSQGQNFYIKGAWGTVQLEEGWLMDLFSNWWQNKTILLRYICMQKNSCLLAHSYMNFDKCRQLLSPQSCPLVVSPSLLPAPSSHRSVFFPIVLPFPECHINGITQYVAFWIWHLSLSIMLLRFSHVAAWISSLFLFIGWVTLRCMDVPGFIYPFTHWRTMRLFLVYDNCEYRHCKCSCIGFCVNISFHFSRVNTQEWDCCVVW